MLLLIEANHGQSIERRIFISRPLEATDLDKYASKMFKKDCLIDLWESQTVPISFLQFLKKCSRPVYYINQVGYGACGSRNF